MCEESTITDSTRKGDSSRWVIGTDTSVAASKGGIEFISPIMTPMEALTTLKKFLNSFQKLVIQTLIFVTRKKM